MTLTPAFCRNENIPTLSHVVVDADGRELWCLHGVGDREVHGHSWSIALPSFLPSSGSPCCCNDVLFSSVAFFSIPTPIIAKEQRHPIPAATAHSMHFEEKGMQVEEEGREL